MLLLVLHLWLRIMTSAVAGCDADDDIDDSADDDGPTRMITTIKRIMMTVR